MDRVREDAHHRRRGAAGSIARLATPWTEPALIAEAHAWLRARVNVVGEITQPHIRVWSTVFRAPTPDGDVFLKLCGPNQAHEPALTALLAREFPGLVPSVIDVDLDRAWMLLRDGGTPLRDALAPAERLAVWHGLLPRYAELQRAFTERSEELLATGTPDRRLESVAALLGTTVLDDPNAHIDAPQRDRVRMLLPRIEAAAEELASAGVASSSIQHDDLHDRNVFVGDGGGVVFDWGDACVTHPFLTLGVTMRSIAHTLHVEPDDAALEPLREAYLEPWHEVAPAERARSASLAMRLDGVLRAISWQHVASLAGEQPELWESLAGWLEEIETAFGDAAAD